MNKPSLDETVSALLDDALDRHEVERLLDQLRQEPQAGERLGRYGLIGMAMRGELAQAPSRDMATAIMARIRAEQVAPARRVTLRDTLREWLEGWRLPALGTALAAGVVAVVVWVVQPVSQTEQQPFVVLTSPQQGGAAPFQLAASDSAEGQDAEALPDPYLVQHLTHAEAGPMSSMASNVRLVAYERP